MRFWVVIMLAALSLPAFGQARRVGADQTLARNADPGVSRRIYTYVMFDPSCLSNGVPNVVIRVPPSHGRVEVKPGSITVNEVREGQADCSGRVMPGTSIYYTSAPGFHGEDRFEYDVVFERSPSRHDTAIVTVR